MLLAEGYLIMWLRPVPFSCRMGKWKWNHLRLPGMWIIANIFLKHLYLWLIGNSGLMTFRTTVIISVLHYIISRMSPHRWSSCCGQGHLWLFSPVATRTTVSDQLWYVSNHSSDNRLQRVRFTVGNRTTDWFCIHISLHQHRFADFFCSGNLAKEGRSTVIQHGWGIWCYRIGHRTHSE